VSEALPFLHNIWIRSYILDCTEQYIAEVVPHYSSCPVFFAQRIGFEHLNFEIVSPACPPEAGLPDGQEFRI
jgi:hypothetical protein